MIWCSRDSMRCCGSRCGLAEAALKPNIDRQWDVREAYIPFLRRWMKIRVSVHIPAFMPCADFCCV